MSVSKNNRMK